MSDPSPTLTSKQTLAQRREEQYQRLTRNFSIAALIICPTLALLPPRKLDAYTFALGTAWVFSANHLTTSYTNQSIWQHIGRHADSSPLPTEKAVEIHKLNNERALQRQLSSLPEQARRAKGETMGKEHEGWMEKIWMGQEKDGWKEKRLREEEEALDEGKGYGDLIMEQIWEVWNWGKKNKEDDDSKRDNRDNKSGKGKS